MDHISNKTVVSLLMVALVVTIIGTIINVSKVTSPQGYSILGAAVTQTNTLGLNQEDFTSNNLNKDQINRIVIILKNSAESSRRATVVGTLLSEEEEGLVSAASIAKTILSKKTAQAELLLNLEGIEIGEYHLQLDTYFDGKLESTKKIKVQVIE